MRIQTAIKNATKKFLNTQKARRITKKSIWGETSYYIITFEQVENRLVVTTWGYDRAEFAIPETRAQVINLKCRAQLTQANNDIDKLIVRYTLDILRQDTKLNG